MHLLVLRGTVYMTQAVEILVQILTEAFQNIKMFLSYPSVTKLNLRMKRTGKFLVYFFSELRV